MAFINRNDLTTVQNALLYRDDPEARAALAILASVEEGIADPALREQANDEYGTDDIEIDDEPATSEADEGVWVAAWVWIARPNEDEEDAAE